MEGVASGIAMASLSIQLIESAGKIKTFIRNIRNVSRELTRLVDLLGRLESSLAAPRELMEQQASLQNQQFPEPPVKIRRCIQRCEATIEPLLEIVEKAETSTSRKSSLEMKLKNNIKFAAKAKDIAEFENKIEREMNHLHNALGIDSSTVPDVDKIFICRRCALNLYSMNLLPILLHAQQNLIANYSQGHIRSQSIQDHSITHIDEVSASILVSTSQKVEAVGAMTGSYGPRYLRMRRNRHSIIVSDHNHGSARRRR